MNKIKLFIHKIMGNKTTSPKGGKRGCLCKNNTYDVKCCEGELINQGVGSTLQQGQSTVVNQVNTRTIVNSSN
jgi:hypothetical protein